jgi:ATP-dependent DNA helicase RecQ
MSAYFPQTNNELLKIHGVGKVKFDRYGKKFLKLITDYCIKYHISSITKMRKQRDKRITKAGKTRRYIVVAEAYQSGRQVEDILNEFNFKLGTFLSHLNRYVTVGNRVNSDGLLQLLEIDSGQRKIAMNLFDKLGTDLLRPVYDELDGKVRYNDLQILRLLAMNKEVLDKKE